MKANPTQLEEKKIALSLECFDIRNAVLFEINHAAIFDD